MNTTRLTLRRLLGYLDGILDEAEAEELRQRIEQREYATQLVHRIRNAKRRLRLAAPRVDGSGMGLDANTVAEYLDYTLDEGRVPDFEKVCLESDVHLSEVASSHEILTLVLAERAQVERSMRDRIYQLPETERAGLAAGGSGISGAAGAAAPAPATAPNPAMDVSGVMESVTDYADRAARRSRLAPLLLAIGLSFLLVIVFLRAVGPFDAQHPVIGRLIGSRDREVSSADGAEGADSAPMPAVDKTPAIRAAGDAPPLPDGGTGEVVDDPSGAGDPAPPDGGEPALPPATLPGDDSRLPVPEEPDRPPAPPAAPTDPPVPAPDTPAPSGPVLTPAPTPGAGGAAPGETAPGETAPGETVPGETAPPSASRDVGRFGDNPDELMARWDESIKQWRRLPKSAVLREGDRLFVPPGFRPQMGLVSGLQVLVVGPAHVELLPSREDGTPQLGVQHGRLVISTIARAGVPLDVSLSGWQGRVIFQETASSLVVETTAVAQLGGDPLAVPPLKTVQLWANGGGIAWRGELAAELKPGEQLVAINGQAQAPGTVALPSWMEVENLRGLAEQDRRHAFRRVSSAVTHERPLNLVLEELAESNLSEVRSLAIRSLAWQGVFEPLLGTLSDEYANSYWAPHIGTLLDILGQGPGAAQQLKIALGRVFPQDAELAYALLCGFDNAQLAAGRDVNLIDSLEKPSMPVRVLAYDNLRRITGGSTYGVRPEHDPATQKGRIAKWRSAQEAGEIRWQSTRSGPPPEPPAPSP